jgi:hypothetical protein
MTFYAAGQHAALAELGLKEASPTMIGMRQRSDPFGEFHRRVDKAFQIKTPKFDVSAQLARLMNNPFKQPTAALAGQLKPLRA